MGKHIMLGEINVGQLFEDAISITATVGSGLKPWGGTFAFNL